MFDRGAAAVKFAAL